MDFEAARYLLSAIIQAIVISWALTIGITAYWSATYFELYREWIRKGASVRIPEHLSREEEIAWIDRDIVDIKRRPAVWVFAGPLIVVSIGSLATVLSGIATLFSFEGASYPYWAVVVTSVLASLTFGAMFFAVLMFIMQTRELSQRMHNELIDGLRDERERLET